MSLSHEDKGWISRELRGSETRLSTELNNSIKSWVREEMHGMETRHLTEFHKWASPMDMRVKSHSATLRALDLELEAANGRISDLEDRSKSL